MTATIAASLPQFMRGANHLAVMAIGADDAAGARQTAAPHLNNAIPRNRKRRPGILAPARRPPGTSLSAPIAEHRRICIGSPTANGMVTINLAGDTAWMLQ